MLHQIKAPQFYTDLGMLNPLANGKIQGLFKAFECFSSTFQGKFGNEDQFFHCRKVSFWIKVKLAIRTFAQLIRLVVIAYGPQRQKTCLWGFMTKQDSNRAENLFLGFHDEARFKPFCSSHFQHFLSPAIPIQMQASR